jgi:dephospho-CoA kinase
MFQNAIVLTGGIASGKSTVSSLLALSGFRIIDADTIAHEVLENSQAQIAEHFGEEFIVQGRIDRKKLGALIFADKQKRLELESIVHPKIKEQIELEAQKQEQFGKPYIIDIPLFFEREGVYKIDKVIVVYTPQEIQLERLVKREGLRKKEAMERINAQLSIESKKERATFLIDNSKDLRHLQSECERVKEEILNACN